MKKLAHKVCEYDAQLHEVVHHGVLHLHACVLHYSLHTLVALLCFAGGSLTNKVGDVK